MSDIVKIYVPDIGDFDKVDVIEILVKPGQEIQTEQSIVTLESDKASMEVPTPMAGVVQEVRVKIGDKVSQGDLLLLLTVSDLEHDLPSSSTTITKGEDQAKTEIIAEATSATQPEIKADSAPSPVAPPDERSEATLPKLRATTESPQIDEEALRKVHAGPAVRLFARELGVDLQRINGSGRKGRILKEDVQAYIKATMERSQGSGPLWAESANSPALPKMPEIDFSKFGPISSKPLHRIRKLSATNLHRNWLLIPHVTQFDQADITELEAFRKAQSPEAEKQGFKLTLLTFLLKAAAAALKEFPEFNSALDPSGENLILRHYYNIGVAVDTENGLVVPVIRDVEQKGLYSLAKELVETSKRARDGKLLPKDFQGGCFTISSLGGIGGTAFTPIINAPEVAILGISRATITPVYREQTFQPRLLLPLSLSYDHRVIDGASAARFIVFFSELLSDIRRLLL
jgi:pyruvate dehydrogenase E2 component (dihydrolipoamide acetyltransferase)